MSSYLPPTAAAVPALSLFSFLLLAGGACTPASADLIQYWPLNEASGVVAPNSVAGGAQGDLYPGAAWVTDPARGQVLEFDGLDGYVSAGSIPLLGTTDNFTWSFWTLSTQGANNNVMLGNRYPDGGWCKFTTAAFEIRDLAASFNGTIDYPDFPTNTWVHHAVTKSGQDLTYYRNGAAIGRNVLTVPFPGAPFYMGGDIANENWAGRIDDVALWTNALPLSSVMGLAAGTYTPLTAPLTPAAPPTLTTALSDDFSGTLAAWTATNRGLENNAPAGYNAPAIVSGQAVLGGTTTLQYWYGSSLESVANFDSRLYSEISVRRVSVTGSGSAYRSSLWLFGDAGHYLHFSQNVGEGGWSTNVRDDGGFGTLNPTGGGNNLAGLDALDGDMGSHVMSFRLLPTATTGSLNVEVLLDGVVQTAYGFTNFPARFQMILTGQGRAGGDVVSATFDDASVKQKSVVNFAPTFGAASYGLPAATNYAPYSQSIASRATDTENDPLTFSKTSGPAWLSVSAAGVISGTAPPTSENLVQVVVSVTDNISGSGSATFSLRVQRLGFAPPPLFGWWPLNETGGSNAADVSGQGRNATVTNDATGGLDTDFSAWLNDPQFGNVLSFEGTDGTSAWAAVGSPPATGTLPVLDASSSFTWAFWCKPVLAPNTDIILGDRYDPNGLDYAPREFIKFTGLSFEWHTEGAGEDLDYPDMPLDAWTHNVIVKDGNTLLYYRNGQFLQGRTVTRFPIQSHAVYFGGQGPAGVETWRGSLSDVRLFNGALSEPGIQSVYTSRNLLPSTIVPITTVSHAADGSVTLTFPTTAGKTYAVDGTTDLGTWVPLSASATSPYTLQAGNPILNPATLRRLFMRVKEAP